MKAPVCDKEIGKTGEIVLIEEVVLELRKIEKRFKENSVLKGISLKVEKGEFITFLGSSGCGKTTTLRIIAGLETPDSGEVFINGICVNQLAPEKRNVNTVFQNYALFPHMNVFENIAYGLKIKKLEKKEIQRKVTDALELIQLGGYEKRIPSELSGGQKQRVAIARAIVNNPQVLLLDEPLGALDLQLRRQMQLELKKLQKQLGITFIYITHDQEEAINMSNRIVIMRDGRLEQIGTPDEIYNHPETSYVAQFVGNANILKGKIHRIEEEFLEAKLAGEVTKLILSDTKNLTKEVGSPIVLAIRSEVVEFSQEKKENSLSAIVLEKSFARGMLRMVLQLSDGSELIASRHGIDAPYEPGEQIYCYWKPEQAVIVKET